jgi:uncharacterized protein (DUF1778 family)
MATTKKAALLVRCSKEEAEAIREAAQREHRTISAFILHALLGRIGNQRRFEAVAKAKAEDISQLQMPYFAGSRGCVS